MKKAFFSFVCMVLMLNLCACATVRKDFELSQERESVKDIEIYKSEQLYDEGDIHLFRSENKPIAIVEEAISDCLNSIEQLTFEKEKVFFPIPMDGGYHYQGYMMIIVYEDGGYDIISDGGLYSYAIDKDGQGKHKYDYANYCGELVWKDFVEKYTEK